jgi:hypothetical protein
MWKILLGSGNWIASCFFFLKKKEFYGWEVRKSNGVGQSDWDKGIYQWSIEINKLNGLIHRMK